MLCFKLNFKFSIFIDVLRGICEVFDLLCVLFLVLLVEEFGLDCVEICMYYILNFIGFRKKYILKRINEGWGL